MPTSRELPQSLAPLTRRNALEMSDSHWDYDIDRLLDALSRIEREKKASLEPERARQAAEDERRTLAAAAEAPPPTVPAPAPRATTRGERARADKLGGGLRLQRRWLVPALVLAAVVAAGIVAAIVLLGGGDNQSGAGGTTAPQSPSRGLAAIIPRPVFRNSCRVQPPLLQGAVETAVCTPPAQSAAGRLPLYPTRWEVSSFANAATLRTSYESLRRRNDIGKDFGRCDGASWGGEGEWFHGPGKPGGRRFCYFEGNVAVMVWSHDKLGQESHIDMLGIVREGGSDHATLFTWWRFWHHRIGKCQQQGCTAQT